MLYVLREVHVNILVDAALRVRLDFLPAAEQASEVQVYGELCACFPKASQEGRLSLDVGE